MGAASAEPMRAYLFVRVCMLGEIVAVTGGFFLCVHWVDARRHGQIGLFCVSFKETNKQSHNNGNKQIARSLPLYTVVLFFFFVFGNCVLGQRAACRTRQQERAYKKKRN